MRTFVLGAGLVRRLILTAMFALCVGVTASITASAATADTCPAGFSYSGAYLARTNQTSLFTDMKYQNVPLPAFATGDHTLGYWTIASFDNLGRVYGWYQLGIETGYTPKFTDPSGVLHNSVYWSTPHVYSEWMLNAPAWTYTRVGNYDFRDEGSASYGTIYTVKLIQSSADVWYGQINGVNAHISAHSIASNDTYREFQAAGEDYSYDTNCDRHDVVTLSMGGNFQAFHVNPNPLTSPWDWCFSTFHTSAEFWDGNFSPVGGANCNPPPTFPAPPDQGPGPLTPGGDGVPPWVEDNVG